MCHRIAAASILLVGSLAASAHADEQYLEFIAALQDRGFHDAVVEYMELIRTRPNLPEDVKALGDYVIGKSLLAGADAVSDLKKRDEQLQQARMHFEKFVTERPKHARVSEAHMDLAQILVERGRVAILHAENPSNQDKRAQFQQQARGSFDAARKRFTDARDRFDAEFKTYPPFIPETEKRQREAKRDTQLNLIQAQFHLGLVEYEYAQSYDKTAPDYKKTLGQSVAIFENVYSRYRSWLAGLYARMWEGKCFEEMADPSRPEGKADLGKAEGFYNELLQHDDKDVALQALQRQVRFFRIIVLNKRGDHVLAGDEAKRWVQENAPYRLTEAGLGVQFERAGALIQQALGKPEKGGERNRLLAEAMTALESVVRYETIYKQPAIVLQQKYKGLLGSIGAIVSFDKAVSLADAAKEARNWPEAARYYGLALRLAKESIDLDELANIRYFLSFAYLQTKDHYQAAVLGEYVARHHAKSPIAMHAGIAALDAYARAYNDQLKARQATEFEETRLVRLADYLIKTWPTANEVNGARFTLAELHMSHDRYEAAAAAYAGVAPDTPEYAVAVGLAGDAYWRAYVEGAIKPPEERSAEKLAAWLQLAREHLAKGVAEQAKKAKPDGPVPLELARAEVNLAEVSLESGQAAESVKLLKALVPKIGQQEDLKPLELRALIAVLRGHVVTDDLAAAQDTMTAIEKTGKDLAQITRVYLDLGKQLQAELDRIKARNDTAAEKRTRDSYVAFLKQMAARKEGQTFATLQWMGEAFFGMGMYREAADQFKQIIERAASDSSFLDRSNRQHQAALTQVKLRQVTALRRLSRFAEAWELVKPLKKEQNADDDPMHRLVASNYDIIMERGLVLQDWGDQDEGRMKTALDHWGFYGQRMEPMQQKPTQYFEIRLNLIKCMMKKASKAPDSKQRTDWLRQAERQLLFVTKTSEQLGGPALKEQYKQLQRQLEKELGRPVGEPTAGTATGRATGN